MTSEAAEIMEKLKDKKAEYEAFASSDSFVHLDDIDNQIITEVLGPKRYGRVRFQGSFVNPTQYFGSSSQQCMPSESQAQAEVQRENMKNSSYNLKQRQQRGKQSRAKSTTHSSYNFRI
ncbi:hypothetical protein Gotur_018844 [Gossypium turneri]